MTKHIESFFEIYLSLGSPVFLLGSNQVNYLLKIGRGLSITDHLHKHKITTKTDIFVTHKKFELQKQ